MLIIVALSGTNKLQSTTSSVVKYFHVYHIRLATYLAITSLLMTMPSYRRQTPSTVTPCSLTSRAAPAARSDRANRAGCLVRGTVVVVVEVQLVVVVEVEVVGMGCKVFHPHTLLENQK